MNALNAPIKFYPEAFKELTSEFETYWTGLPWVDRVAPRKEAFVAKSFVEYTYGRGAGERTYRSEPIPEFMLGLWSDVEKASGNAFELCFCNGYIDGRDHLGWHADDSDSVDDNRPIAIVSIGAEREIWFRDNERTFVDKLSLPSGSLVLMSAGMQDTHEHRIPKHGAICGPRISFTFRGLVNE